MKILVTGTAGFIGFHLAKKVFAFSKMDIEVLNIMEKLK